MSKPKTNPSGVFKVGAISLAFLILGYQVALFVHRAAVSRMQAHRDSPDTVYVVDRELAREVLGAGAEVPRTSTEGSRATVEGMVPGTKESRIGTKGSRTGTEGSRATVEGMVPGTEGSRIGTEGSRIGTKGSRTGTEGSRATVEGRSEEAPIVIRKSSLDKSTASRQSDAGSGRNGDGFWKSGDGFGRNGDGFGRGGSASRRRAVENFRFNPNTVSVEDLMRLGFSEKQAQSIDNYRQKGGRFRRKSDFARSYVVDDSVFRRLEPFIDIPKLDINKADSAAFDSLPGIGGWFASRMVEYRRRLHGYSCPEQLLEIYRFDRERYDGLRDLITCSPAPPYPLWSLPVDSLRLHPHIGSWQTARAIVFFREHNPREKWTVDALLGAGILSEEQAAKLRLCRLE